MFYALIAIIILTYPIGSGIAYGVFKIIKWLVNKNGHPTRFVTTLLPLILAIFIYPVHWEMDTIDVTMPLWMLLLWHFDSGAVNYFLPETLMGSGYNWLDFMPGIIYKVIWLIFVVVAIKKLFVSHSSRPKKSSD